MKTNKTKISYKIQAKEMNYIKIVIILRNKTGCKNNIVTGDVLNVTAFSDKFTNRFYYVLDHSCQFQILVS